MGLVKIITEVGEKIQNAESHGTILDQTWEFSKLDGQDFVDANV
jgi:hypothetical protein